MFTNRSPAIRQDRSQLTVFTKLVADSHAIMTITDPSDAHLLRCWRQQDCKGCLHEDRCSWCPFVGQPHVLRRALATDTTESWSCVPNNHTIQALAPAYDENVCPHWAERWEIRTRPLGCQVSTITSLTSIISIASTLVVLSIILLVVWACIRLRRHHKQAEPGWWKFWKRPWGSWTSHAGLQPGSVGDTVGEHDPLLRQ